MAGTGCIDRGALISPAVVIFCSTATFLNYSLNLSYMANQAAPRAVLLPATSQTTQPLIATFRLNPTGLTRRYLTVTAVCCEVPPPKSHHFLTLWVWDFVIHKHNQLPHFDCRL